MPLKKVIAPFYERLSLILIGIIALGFLVNEGKELLDPLIFGFLFAILLLPISNFLEKKLRLHRSASSFLSILLLTAFIGGIFYLVGSQISNLAEDWPMLKNQIGQSANDLQQWIQSAFHINMVKQAAYVHNATNKIINSSASVIGTTFGAVSSLMLFYAFIFIFTFLILFYRRLLIRFLLYVFRDENEAVVIDVVENIQTILRKYILGLLLEMFIVACVACTIFWIIGIKYAALLGIITGLFNIIPYIGIFSALILSTAITFATSAPSHAVYVAISVITIHAVDSNFLLPLVVGSKVRLNALITFIGIVVGEMLWGLSGMFLSIPMIAICKIIFDRVESLKPWGFLFGGEYEYKKSAEKAMKTE
jgi:predicted PurR-regulated permease PerM